MKVKQLIAELQKYDGELEAVYCDRSSWGKKFYIKMVSPLQICPSVGNDENLILLSDE
jgi:hypothetical protein